MKKLLFTFAFMAPLLVCSLYAQCVPSADIIFYGTQSNSSISTIGVDGASNDQVIINGAASMIRRVRIDASAGFVFWTAGNSNAIYKCNLDGSDQTTIVTGLGNPNSLALDTKNQVIYFGESSNLRIRKIDYSGTNLTTVVNSAGLTQGIELDLIENKIYWTDFNSGSVKSFLLDGSNVSTIINLEENVFDLILHKLTSTIYVSHRGDNTIKKFDFEGNNLNTIYNSTSHIGALAIDLENDKLFVISDFQNIVSLDLDGTNASDVFDANSTLSGIEYGSCPVTVDQVLINYIQNLEIISGLKNSLAAKIENALTSLNDGHCETAINQLNAFINQVEAQRGKKLTDEEADNLISYAQAIIDAINDGTIDCTENENNSTSNSNNFHQDLSLDISNDAHLSQLNSRLTSENYIGYKVFPNPFSQDFNVSFKSKELGIAQVDVYGIFGSRVLKSQKLQISHSGLTTMKFDNLNLADGIYLVRLTMPSGESFVEKVVKSQ
jgi:hypothetical protein